MGKYKLINYKRSVIQGISLPEPHWRILGHAEMGQFKTLSQAKAAVVKMEKRAKNATGTRARNLGWWAKPARRGKK